MKKTNQDNKSTKNNVIDPIDQILDEQNDDNIFYPDENNVLIEYEQIAVIFLESTQKSYAILIPATTEDDEEYAEAVFFEIEKKNKKLHPITDENIIDEIIETYERMV